MTRFFSAILFFLFTLQGFTQDYKRTSNWYFGDSADISFVTFPPAILNNGLMSTIEGSAYFVVHSSWGVSRYLSRAFNLGFTPFLIERFFSMHI